MADPGIPTMSSGGYITDTPTKADRLMSYFIVSLFSQSNLFRGKITSLPYILQQSGDDLTKFKSDTRDSLTAYLSRYFTKLVEVNVSSEAIQGNDGLLNITFTITVQSPEDQVAYTFGKIGSIANGKLQQIIDVINN